MHVDLIKLARTPETSLRIEQYVPAPPYQVFAAWVDPDQMGDWYAPTDDFGPTIGQVDPQVGGNYRITMFPPAPWSRMSSLGNTASSMSRGP